MSIELVVLDMAGTTVMDNDAVNECLRLSLSERGIEVNRNEINRVMGMPKPVAIGLLLNIFQTKQRKPEADEIMACHQAFVEKMVHFYLHDERVKEISGATQLFEDLHRMNVKVALDTGFSRNIVNVILQRLNWRSPGLLDATVASDEVSQGRPQPDLIYEAMRRTGVTDTQKVMKVGDTPSDLLEGQAAQSRCIVGVTYGSHTRMQLATYPHTHLIDRLDEIPAILGMYSKK